MIGTDENWHTFYFTPPAKDGDLYITIDSYLLNVVPESCTSGTATNGQVGTSPLIKTKLLKARSDNTFKTNFNDWK